MYKRPRLTLPNLDLKSNINSTESHVVNHWDLDLKGTFPFIYKKAGRAENRVCVYYFNTIVAICTDVKFQASEGQIYCP